MSAVSLYPTDGPMAEARAEHLRRTAVRALDDPVTLARAARIVREALARKRLTLDDINPDDRGAAA
jgi:hypothetical protein